MIDEKDIKSLEDRFDTRYKMLKDCVTDMTNVRDLYHAVDKRMTEFETNQKHNNWLTGLIAGGIVALVIKVFLGG